MFFFFLLFFYAASVIVPHRDSRYKGQRGASGSEEQRLCYPQIETPQEAVTGTWTPVLCPHRSSCAILLLQGRRLFPPISVSLIKDLAKTCFDQKERFHESRDLN